jgi:hypothetical protein
MKYSVLLALVTCVSFVAVSQTPVGPSANPKCGLTRAQSPEVRGVRLGMTAEQLLALFADDPNHQRINEAIKNSKLADRYGFARFDLRADTEGRDSKFQGVNYITVEMLDERVTSFYVSYAGPEWNTAEPFVAKLSEAFHLPPSPQWEPRNQYGRFVKCAGFEVEAYVGSENTVRVHDPSARGVVADRRQAAKEKERQAFKP